MDLVNEQDLCNPRLPSLTGMTTYGKNVSIDKGGKAKKQTNPSEKENRLMSMIAKLVARYAQ